MKTIFKTLCVLAVLYVWMLPGETEYDLAKKQGLSGIECVKQ